MTGKNRTLILIIALISLIGVSLGALALTQPAPKSDPVDAAAIQDLGPAPDFTVDILDGEAKSLKDYRGKPVVVNFWASWCPPCREEAPALERVHEKYKDKVEFVGIIFQDREADSRAFIKEFGIKYENGIDPNGAAARAYKITGIPTTYVIDSAGTVRAKWLGAISESQLSSFIEAALSAS